MPTAYFPALICFGRERVWWIICNYPKVLKEKTWRNRKSTACAICWLKSVLHEEKRRTGSDSGRTNATKTVSDVFRHRSGTGKSYCRMRFDVGSERDEPLFLLWHSTTQILSIKIQQDVIWYLLAVCCITAKASVLPS
jgi:hypothetical protein